MARSEVTKYAEDVVSGKIAANKWTMYAAQRHLKDLAAGVWTFDNNKANQVYRFYELLRHTTGEMAGQPFKLEPWQKFIVGSVFGWVDDEGFRRYRRAYVEVPRKNGKTTLAAPVALYCLLADDEEAAQVYTAATKLDQAAICFEEAYRMIEYAHPAISEEVTSRFNSRNNRVILAGNNKMTPLSSEYKTLDGLNVHCAIIDEYHAHPNDELYNVIRNGMGARRQPLLFTITTAGFNRQSACYKHREFCQKVLAGMVKDERLFAVIYGADEDDDWLKVSTRKKANPNYGVSINPEHIEQQIAEAKESITKEVEFKTKILNIWTDAAKTWIPESVWSRGNVKVKPDGKCWSGLDLASVSDFSAACHIFETDRGIECLWRYWLPEEAVRTRKDGVGDQIRAWVRDGFITMTPGNVTDYDYIKGDLLADAQTYDIQVFNYDRYNSTQLVIDLVNEGLPMNEYSQGTVSMNAPVREIERLAGLGQLLHGSNPVTAWMISNVVLKTDSGGNVKMDKGSSSDKIDGPVALAMALAGYMDAQREEPKGEWFEPILL